MRSKGRGEDFAVLERATEVGGVWRDNTYPGCACDIPSHLYSLSFAPNPDWARAYSGQSEIRDYLRRAARDYGLLPYIRFGCNLLEAAWDDAAQLWRIETSAGPAHSSSVLIDASEPDRWSRPVPDLPGLDRFAGEVFCIRPRWNRDVELTGRNVVVIGTGASAGSSSCPLSSRAKAGRMTVVQRTAPWVTPRIDRRTTRFERQLYAAAPWLLRIARQRQYLLRELVTWKIMVSPRVRRIATRLQPCGICAGRWQTRCCARG